MKEFTNQDKMILTAVEHLLEDGSNLKENAESIKSRLERFQGMIQPSDYQSKLIELEMLKNPEVVESLSERKDA